jgi:hypothetical protein
LSVSRRAYSFSLVDKRGLFTWQEVFDVCVRRLSDS